MQPIFQHAQTLLASLQNSLYGQSGAPPYNNYDYGFAYGQTPAELTLQLSTPGYAVPAQGTANVGWSGNGNNYSRSQGTAAHPGGYPFVGNVSGLPAPTEAEYLAVTDCSGFAAYMVQRVAPAPFDNLCGGVQALEHQFPELAALDQRHTQPWPSAAVYAFAGYSPAPPAGFQVVATGESLADVLRGSDPDVLPQAGDILAWSGDPNAAQKDSGHVMILMQNLASSGTEPHYNAHVEVCDSSALAHMNDSRGSGSSFRPGVGTGQIQVTFTGQAWWFGFQAFGTEPPASPGFQPDHFSILRLASQQAAAG